MTAPRPTCVHCGRAYGHRLTVDETIVWKSGTAKPPYRGNGHVVKESMWHTAPHAVSGSAMGQPFGHDDNVVTRSIWDGEKWWGGYPPFCRLVCALDYARRAFAKLGRLA